MKIPRERFLSVSLAGFLAAAVSPPRLAAQLVRDPAPSQQQSSVSNQNSANPAPSGKPRLSQEIQISGDQSWADTGIDVQAGERMVITASGKLRYADQQSDNGPEGIPRGFKDLLRILPFNDAGRGALIGRIGDATTSQPFLIGASHDSTAPISGRLAVGINQASDDTGAGTYMVRVAVYPPAGGKARVVARQVPSLPGIDNSLFAKIPRRITDKSGNLGDMVNFLVLGSQAALERVFTTAGWVKVDPDVGDAVLHGLLESLSKESYLTMPMSQLCLFGRFQDYGWAHAEPIRVVASRNHLRIWKAAYLANGQTLWAGAATHDIGFERDQRNNGLTHKIDPDIDLERDYVEKTLASTGYVTDITHFTPSNPLTDARTATGGGFHSNGQVLVLKLDETNLDSSQKLLVQNISTGPNNSGCPVSPATAPQTAAGRPASGFAPQNASYPGANPAPAPAPAAYASSTQAAPANQLQIVEATYGTSDHQRDVADLLRSKLSGNSLQLVVSNDSMGGDPAPDHKKHLRVVYLWQGTRYETILAEHDTLTIP